MADESTMPPMNEIQKRLRDLDYPANRDELVQHARSQGATEQECSFLERIPNRDYDSPTEVSEELGNLGESDSDMGMAA